jgi:hypothetical protein
VEVVWELFDTPMYITSKDVTKRSQMFPIPHTLSTGVETAEAEGELAKPYFLIQTGLIVSYFSSMILFDAPCNMTPICKFTQ